MKDRCVYMAMALSLACLSVTACMKSDDPAEQRAYYAARNKATVKVAAAGPWSQKRNLLRQGLELACEEVNAEGGVLSRRVELIPFDDDSDVGVGQETAYEIASVRDIVAVIGHSASAVSVPNSILYHYYGILMLSPLSTSVQLTSQGLNKVFRNIPSDSIFGMEAANFCRKMGWEKILVYYQDNSYGASQANVFEQQCSSLDIEVADRTSYDASTGRKEIAETADFWLRNYAFDAVYVAGVMPQAGQIVAILRQHGILEPIIGGDAFDHPLLLSTAKEYAEDVYAVTIYDDDSTHPAFRDFKGKFNGKYGKDADQAALQGYDALKVLVAAIARADSLVPAKIAESLRSMGTWEGPAGPYTFDKDGNAVGKTVVVKKVQGGRFVKVR